MPIPEWLKGAPKLPTFDEQDSRQNNITGTTNFAAWGTIGGTPDLAGPATSADLELWRKQRAEKVASAEDPGKSIYRISKRQISSFGADLEYHTQERLCERKKRRGKRKMRS
jgi:hypothetical protein